MGYARRLALNTIVQLGGRVATTVVSLATVSLLNGNLRAEGYGQYIAATTYVGFFAVLADLGLNLLFLRELSRYPEKQESLTAEFVGFRLVTAAGVLAIAPLVALAVPVYRPYVEVIAIICLGQLLLVLNQLLVSLFQVRLLMGWATLTDLVGRVTVFLGVWQVGRYFSPGSRLEAIVWIVVLGSAVNILLSYLLVRRYQQVRISLSFARWRTLLRMTLPMGSLAVLGLIHFKADSVLLTLLRPAIEVGIYGNAYKIVEVLLVVPAIFVGGIFPALNQAVFHRDASLPTFFQKSFDLILFAVYPICLSVALFAPYIMGIITRENSGEAARALQVLTLAMVPWFIGYLFSNTLLAADGQRSLVLVELTAVVLNVLLNIWAIPRYAYLGAAWVTVGTELCTTGAVIWLVVRQLQVRPKLAYAGRATAAAFLLLILAIAAEQFVSVPSYATYVALPRLQQAAITLLLFAGFGALYALICALFRIYPPALQDRLNQLRRPLAS